MVEIGTCRWGIEGYCGRVAWGDLGFSARNPRDLEAVRFLAFVRDRDLDPTTFLHSQDRPRHAAIIRSAVASITCEAEAEHVYGRPVDQPGRDILDSKIECRNFCCGLGKCLN